MKENFFYGERQKESGGEGGGEDEEGICVNETNENEVS